MEARAGGVVAGLAEAAEASGVLVEVPRAGVGPAEAGNNTLWSAAACCRFLPLCGTACWPCTGAWYLDRCGASKLAGKKRQQAAALQSRGARTMIAEQSLTDLVTRLKNAAGSNLLSVILYGSAVTDEFQPKHSDLNVLCIMRELGKEELSKLHAASTW